LGFTLQGFAPPGYPRTLSDRPSLPDVTQSRWCHASSVHHWIRTSSRFMRPRECSDRPSPRHRSAREAVPLGHRLGLRPETIALLVFILPRASSTRSQSETVVSQSAHLLSPAPLPFGSGPVCSTASFQARWWRGLSRDCLPFRGSSRGMAYLFETAVALGY